ncbi:MAG: serine hydrolase [Synergistaceae bacterium]|nr:serine hydrolase [Synergistaceae bacterium]
MKNAKTIFGTLIIFALLISPSQAFTKISSLPPYQWQKTANFPDQLGRVDDSLALNSMVSFHFWHSQGVIYLKVSEGIKHFDMFINSKSVNTSLINSAGNYALDISDYTVDGINTLQISNIDSNKKNAVSVYIPYPVILKGSLDESGIRPESMALISDIIESDIANGFPSAQLAVIRNGRLVYSNAWGKDINTNTLYDLASVSKMFGVNYAIQKLVSEKKLDVDSRIIDVLGREFANDVLAVKYSKSKTPDINTMRNWKASITIKDVMCHRAGFPPEIYYHDKNYDLSQRKHDDKASNPLYTGIDGSDETRAKTLKAIFRTPLYYQPRTKIMYSDIDYMLLAFVIEKVSGQRLDDYMRKNFWQPMNLTRIAYNPLKNNFSHNNCAPTELYGNARDGHMTFDGIRTYTLRGEVHDYKAFHSMGGVSGHAGLFSNAENIAYLASVMLTGGYGGYKFFSRNVIDSFTAPQSSSSANWGIGWWREGDNQRVWYFGTQSSSHAFGHQGWTGTLVIVDPSRNLVIAYLTNKISSPVVKPYTGKKIYAGNWYTAATLGFVSQILSIGMDCDKNINISNQLLSLLKDMARDSEKLIPKGAGNNHPSVLNAKSKRDLLMRRK